MANKLCFSFSKPHLNEIPTALRSLNSDSRTLPTQILNSTSPNLRREWRSLKRHIKRWKYTKSSIRAYFANAARFCKSVYLLLPLTHSIALYTSWCFLIYAMANCVLPIPPRPCTTWIFRPPCGPDGSGECSICSISISRSTKLPATGRPVRWKCTRKSSYSIAECSIRLESSLI